MHGPCFRLQPPADFMENKKAGCLNTSRFNKLYGLLTVDFLHVGDKIKHLV